MEVETVVENKVTVQCGTTKNFYYNGVEYSFEEFTHNIACGSAEIAFILIEKLMASNEIVYESPERNKRLIFANVEYTLGAFADEVTQGDVALAKEVLNNLKLAGSVTWVDELNKGEPISIMTYAEAHGIPRHVEAAIPQVEEVVEPTTEEAK